MRTRAGLVFLLLSLCLGSAFATGCGDDDSAPSMEDSYNPYPEENNRNDGDYDSGYEPPMGEPDDEFIPEEEEFLVREVATTAAYVFVPNSSPESNTVALIDGRDYSIRPMPVGREPTVVRAASVEGAGDVAYVLCEGDATVAIIRADEGAQDPVDQVNLLRVPREVNALSLSPDGRHLLAYIDPEKPLRADSGVASLQAAALIRLGDTRADDQVFDLSVTRSVRDIEFTEDSDQAFMVGREGINRIYLNEIDGDTFVAPLPLELSGSLFAPTDFEIEVDPAGEYLVARSSDFSGVALYRPPTDASEASLRFVELSAIPTDIDLYTREDGSPALIATLRASGEVALIDVNASLSAPEDSPAAPLILPVAEISAGLALLTPTGDQALLYSTLVDLPTLGILDLATSNLRSFELRNRIRSVAISPDAATAVVVHKKRDGQPPADADPLTFFQYNHGLTLLDMATGYRRPVLLEGEPADLVLTQDAEDTSFVYVMQQSDTAAHRGVTRINLSNYRTDFFKLARHPQQMGLVAGKIFVSQTASEGRITFFDVDTGAQRTVSGYELNAGIK
ncbi:hypothetical protein [Bradymonas sediminis]|uniref:hypothetical protein n=1 Tax=Bradymonas sediminis TaxID=1548548 RepID=UPI00105D9EBB|nr:hypothetical protein [Bradymonas sediminis]TDP75785.1 hypothetical protein DFR33_103124 [Bradymonas sediminis]